MTKRRFYLSFLVFGSIIAFSSCSSKPDTSWFTSSPCEAPCWFDIVPGKTTSSELLPLLLENTYIDDKSIANRDVSLKIFNDIYYFNLKNHVEGEIWLLDDRISSIFWGSPGDGEITNSLGLTVGELINKFGEPDFVVRVNDLGPGLLPISDAVHPIVFLINSKKGIVISYDEYRLPKKYHNRVAPDIEVGSLEFFSPDDFDRLLEVGAFTMFETETKEDALRRLRPWKGYGEYTN